VPHPVACLRRSRVMIRAALSPTRPIVPGGPFGSTGRAPGTRPAPAVAARGRPRRVRRCLALLPASVPCLGGVLSSVGSSSRQAKALTASRESRSVTVRPVPGVPDCWLVCARGLFRACCRRPGWRRFAVERLAAGPAEAVLAEVAKLPGARRRAAALAPSTVTCKRSWAVVARTRRRGGVPAGVPGAAVTRG
jgi:hypothetical protein